jgi:hypothetical protein
MGGAERDKGESPRNASGTLMFQQRLYNIAICNKFFGRKHLLFSSFGAISFSVRKSWISKASSASLQFLEQHYFR